MSPFNGKTERLLLIDTCGEGAGVGVSVGREVIAVEELPRSGGSAEIVSAVGRVLAEAGCVLAELSAIGVVSGPGSFTGVRVGMAAAKGLAEASGVQMIAVSRLEVLARGAALREGRVVLDAGRGELYVADVATEAMGSERLMRTEDAGNAFVDCEVVAAEERVALRLRELGVQVRLYPLQVSDVRGPVADLLQRGCDGMSLEDANYVRRESDIYAQKSAAAGKPVS